MNALLPSDKRFGALNLLIVKREEKFLQRIPVHNNSKRTVLHKAEIQNDWDYKKIKINFGIKQVDKGRVNFFLGCRDGAVVRALASHQSDPGLILA